MDDDRLSIRLDQMGMVDRTVVMVHNHGMADDRGRGSGHVEDR